MDPILSFYHKIYKQELSQAKLIHLYSSRVLKRYFIGKTEEVLNDELPYLPLGDKIGEEIVKTLELKANEVELTYYSLGRISQFISLNKYKSTRVYPLFAYRAKVIIKEGVYYVEIDKESRKLLKNNIPTKITGDRAFQKLNLTKTVDLHFTSELAEIIQKQLPNAETDELLLYPELWTSKKIKSNEKKKFIINEKYIPLGVLALVEKENNSFTTLDELEKIANKSDLSDPLAVLFSGKENKSQEKKGILCEELNTSQYQAIKNSNEKIISVISGPPGTGKSFTIANLAAEKVSKGQSILITSKNKEALDVIEGKIKDQLGIENLCVNPSQDKNFAWMKDHLSFILGRKYQKKNIQFNAIELAFEKIQVIYDNHIKLEKKLMHSFKIERDYTLKLENGFTKYTGETYKQRIYEHRGKTRLPLWESLQEYYKRIDNIRKSAVKTLQLVNAYMLEDGIKNSRMDLRDYLAFLRAREPKRKENLAKKIQYQAVLKAFPVWLVRANDVSRVLPLKKEVFDILIIDEASQCDIPSIIPLIQRAKKVVIVGDTKQLTHISFIAKAFERAAKANVPENLKYLCQHRDRSILHLVEDFLDPQDRIELNEHFRSQFPIIAFSNDQFYKNRLDILTKRPISVAEHVQFIKTNGKRISGHHAKETTAIIEKIQQIIAKEKDLPNHLKTSIGILSPFRKQVDFLFKAVIETFKLSEIKAYKIIVGTAFTFQGNERDIMLISLSLDNDSLGGSFTFLNRKDVFNVSVTRARNTQLIYYSFDAQKLKADSTIANFFRFYDKNLEDDLGRDTKDEFCLEIAEIFKEKGLKTWTNFEISGVSIDLLTQFNNEFIGIDLIGFPGEMEDYYSLERYKMIARGKIRLFPLSYPLWRGDKKRCLQAVLDLITMPKIKEKKIEKKKKPAIKKDISAVKKKPNKPSFTPILRAEFQLVTSKTERENGGVFLEFTLKGSRRLVAKMGVAFLAADKINSKGFFTLKINKDHKNNEELEAFLMKTLFDWIKEKQDLKKISINITPAKKNELNFVQKYGFINDVATSANKLQKNTNLFIKIID